MPLNINDSSTWMPSKLITPVGPILYWVLADWDAYYEQYEDVNNLTRVLIAVNWWEAPDFKTYALGTTDRIGTATYFERYTPLLYQGLGPLKPSQYLTSLKKVKIHVGTDTNGVPQYAKPDPSSGWPDFPGIIYNSSGLPLGMQTRIIYDAVFTCPPYDIVDQPTFLGTDKKELRRYVTREQQIVPKERKTPSFGFETYNPANPATTTNPPCQPIPEVGFVPFHSIELHYTWRKVPVENVPGTAIGKCLNKINNAAFDINADGTYGRFATGTVLFRGLANKLTPYRGPNAEWLIDIPYVFDYQYGDGTTNTWNKLPRNDGTWASIRVRETNPPQPLYYSDDFEALFQPGP